MRKTLSMVLSLLLVLSLFGSAMAASDKLNEPGAIPVAKEGAHLTVGTRQIATVTDYDDNHFTNYLREKTGVDIDVFLFDNSEYKTQLQLMTTSGEKLPDTMWNIGLTGIERESYGTQGYFVDLRPYFDAHELTYYFDGEAASYLTESEKQMTITAGLSSNGALYAFPFWAIGVADPWSSGVIVNNTFCEALGMEIPTTIDEYYDYLVAVKTQDPNGNGLQDEIPLVGYQGSSWGDPIGILINSFTYYPATWSGTGICATDDGQLYLPYMTDEKFKEGLAFVHKLYAEGLLSDLSFSQDSAALRTMIDLTGDDLDVVGSVTAHRSTIFANHNSAERRTHYTSLGPLVGPEGVANCASYACEPVYSNYITTDCEDPDVAFAVLDFMTSTESTLTCRYGRENEYWRYCNDEEKARGIGWAEIAAGIGFTEPLYTSSSTPEIPMKLCWGQETNEIWNITCITWQPIGFCALGPKASETSYASETAKYNAQDWNHAVTERYGKAPKNLVGSLAYTAEEQAQLGTIASDLGTYAREAMTLFVTGEMDIERDWDTFQANLEALGASTYLQCAQAAWDRAHS